MGDWPRALIFDFDGVIVNSEPLHFMAFRDVLAQEQIGLPEDEYYRELLGFDDQGAFKHVFAKHDRPLDPKTFLRVMTRKSETMMDLIRGRRYQALPGVEELVRGVWRHYPLGICSGALRDEIEAMLEGVNLRDCFKVIVAVQDVTVGKPDPQGYLLAMKQLEPHAGAALRPADCLVVEDAPSVIRSAKSAGFATLAVATSHPPDMLADADYVVERLEPALVSRAIPPLKIMG